MIDWYKKVVFQNYANFSGRALRSEYWWFYLANSIIFIIATILDNVLHTTTGTLPYGAFYFIYALATLIPSLAVAVRRIHDSGKSGWFILVPFYSLYLLIIEGDRGPNEYGPNPDYNHDELNEIGVKE